MTRFTKKEIIIFILIIVLLSFTIVTAYSIKQSKKYIVPDYTEDKIIGEFEEEEEVPIKEADENIEENIVKPEPKEIIIDICGAVMNPGVVKLLEGDRVINAVEKAGGLTEKADIKRINLAKKVSDGEKIIILEIGEVSENIETQVSNISYKSDNKVNINTASKGELKNLNGIGDVLADRIIEYRESNNNFKSIEEIKEVKGIGEKKFEEIKDDIKI